MAKLTGRPLEILTSGRNHAHVAIPAADGTVQTVIDVGTRRRGRQHHA